MSCCSLNSGLTLASITKHESTTVSSIDENPSEALEDRVIENYFSFMANIILSFKSKEVA